MNIKINDIVRFIDDVGGGRVSRIEGRTIYVEDDNGFERPALERDLVVVGQVTASRYERPITPTPIGKPDKPAAPPKPEPLPVVEEPDGDRLNIVVAYEARELKHLNTTTFFASLTNDSNYFLYATYLTRGDDYPTWTTRWHGIVEPNIQVDLGEVGHADLNDMTHIAVQYIAFKQGKEFELKNPALVEKRLNVNKFVKLHCFQEHRYYDVPVIAVDITRNDRPESKYTIDSGELQAALNGENKHNASTSPRHRKRKPAQSEPVVVDLHIHELLDSTAGMSNGDILNYQLDKFNETMRDYLGEPGRRIVFIHGKGEGVLRRAILEEVKRHYSHCEVQDASFQEYGFGATQITIHQR